MTTFDSPATVLVSAPEFLPPSSYNLPIGYLRAFVTLLVLAHHSVLAYYAGISAPAVSLLASPHLWEAFPVLDSQRWAGFSLFVAWNDMFFMSLMFFLSGLFVWRSLQRKGTRTFLRDRAVRLGIPFLLMAAVVAPIAYYPAYLRTPGAHSIAGFAHEWLSLGEWPAGPAWFVWVLLAFDSLAAMLFLAAPKAGVILARFGSLRPAQFFGWLLVLSALCYIPMELLANPLRWSVWGPFYFQTSRILHYLLYFAAGIGVGAFGIDRGLLAPSGGLARSWRLWCSAALGAFVFAVITGLLAMTHYMQSPYMWGIVSGTGFVLSCASSCFALLALFVRFARTPRRIFDSLRDNAYGMYLIHYAFVSWVQYCLLRWLLPGFAKGIVAFACVLVLSLVTTAALRRVPLVSRIL